MIFNHTTYTHIRHTRAAIGPNRCMRTNPNPNPNPIRPKKLHALLEALWDFEASHGGALPAPGNKADAEAVRAKALEMLGRIPKGLFDVEICVKSYT